MFAKRDMKVLDWWLFWILMAIPLVNIIVFVLLLLSKDTNKSLKNYLLALILPVVIFIILLISGFLSLGILDSLLG